MAYYEDFCRVDVSILKTEEYLGCLQAQIGQDVKTARFGNLYRVVRIYEDGRRAEHGDYNYGAIFGDADDGWVNGNIRPVMLKFRLGRGSGELGLARAFREQDFTLKVFCGDQPHVHVIEAYPRDGSGPVEPAKAPPSQPVRTQPPMAAAEIPLPTALTVVDPVQPATLPDIEAFLRAMQFQDIGDIARARKGLALLLHADHARDPGFRDAQIRATGFLDQVAEALR